MQALQRGASPRPVSTKEFEKARKKCLTNGIECGNLAELLTRAARDTAKFLLKELQKVLKNLKKVLDKRNELW